ncbi:hypothetical protein JFL43_07685 [Viridibacillus sp. YIM B01967]|uniref:Ketosynthase family 3 (KS3) domain-containing protein n=1 Tax=Viridibacillus soli TaxID=2798301 RepID=A0ABS1H5P4_9BACL|nr:polyketide synthase [Viridibacillus soli]MBK3494738.1 hypothetical protein [Viridibacillus soli]
MKQTEKLNRSILELYQKGEIDKSTAFDLLKMLNKADDDIAVIGIAVKLPGADNVQTFWNQAVHGVNVQKSFTGNRKKDVDALFQKKGHPPQQYFNGGFLENIDQFDADYFGISEEEAQIMDPYHRLFLETAYEAIEDAGYAGGTINGTRTGVYIGNDHTNKLLASYLGILQAKDFKTMIGSWTSVLASRVSHAFNLTGPSMVIDTGCSSALVAVHTACKALNNKDCSMAVAGGINVFLIPSSPDVKGVGMEENTPEIKTRVFDRNPGGTSFGEGVVSLLLKPLKKALKDQDNIHAVIKGSAVNNNGSRSQLSEMSSKALEEVVTEAWKDADVDPETIDYIEVHGIAASIGDAMEISGIQSAFRKRTPKKQFCALGSSKGNTGHLVAASGITSLVKVISALKEQTIPPSINFSEPNKMANLTQSALYISDRAKPWRKKETPRRAGVNSYGFSGTNCHVIVEEAPKQLKQRDGGQSAYVFTLSANNLYSFARLIQAYISFLKMNEEEVDLEDVCYTAATGRTHHQIRLALEVKTAGEIREKLEKFRYGQESGPGIYSSLHEQNMENYRNWETSAGMGGTSSLSDTKNLCYSYVHGEEINWQTLYENHSCRKISLPVYPFAPTRYWID